MITFLSFLAILLIICAIICAIIGMFVDFERKRKEKIDKDIDEECRNMIIPEDMIWLRKKSSPPPPTPSKKPKSDIDKLDDLLT